MIEFLVAMPEIEKLTELLNNRSSLVAMLAPSFPVVYEYPQIVARLRQLGFSKVVEVTAGAKMTNQEVLTVLKENPTARFISSPCPGFVRYIRNRHPELVPYLAFKADSPMIATAKIVKEKYTGSEIVFVGPCIAKKLEASEDYPELNIIVITYKELDALFKNFDVGEVPVKSDEKFDVAEASTRIYPTDGGLTVTSGLNNVLRSDEILIVSGVKNLEPALEEFKNNPKIRFMDALFCEGGCINGPGIVSLLPLEERKRKVLAYAAKTI